MKATEKGPFCLFCLKNYRLYFIYLYITNSFLLSKPLKSSDFSLLSFSKIKAPNGPSPGPRDVSPWSSNPKVVAQNIFLALK